MARRIVTARQQYDLLSPWRTAERADPFEWQRGINGDWELATHTPDGNRVTIPIKPSRGQYVSAGANGELPENLTFRYHPEGFDPFPAFDPDNPVPPPGHKWVQFHEDLDYDEDEDDNDVPFYLAAPDRNDSWHVRGADSGFRYDPDELKFHDRLPPGVKPEMSIDSWPTVSAHDGDRLAGYLQWIPEEEQERHGEIRNIQVHPDYQRRGVGTALFDHVKTHHEPLLRHSDNLTPDGQAWSSHEQARHKLGGPRRRFNQEWQIIGGDHMPLDAISHYMQRKETGFGDEKSLYSKGAPLSQQITERGYEKPVELITDGKSGTVYDGHHRIDVARQLGHTHVPVQVTWRVPDPVWGPGGAYGNKIEPWLKKWLTDMRGGRETVGKLAAAWYHTSPRRLPVGTDLVPGGGRSSYDPYYRAVGEPDRKNHVWVEDDPAPLKRWHDIDADTNYHYRVEPDGDPRPYRDGDTSQGYVVPRARIVEDLGPAKRRRKGKLLYHRTTPENAAAINRIKKFNPGLEKGQRPDAVFFSTNPGDDVGQARGYGDGLVALNVPDEHFEDEYGEFQGGNGWLDDEFPSGEQHWAIPHQHLRPEWFVDPKEHHP